MTASFLKELLRRAALYAAQDEEPGDAPADRPLRVADAHMNAALDRLLDTRSQLTRTLLGGRPPQDTAPPSPSQRSVQASGSLLPGPTETARSPHQKPIRRQRPARYAA